MKYVAQYDMNTIPTVVQYIGSDDSYDYFYIDVPLGRNRACKVRKTETLVDKRRPVTRDRSQWSLYHFIQGSLTNPVMIREGTNISFVSNTNQTSKER